MGRARRGRSFPLTPQVGAADDPGQDAQPILHRLLPHCRASPLVFVDGRSFPTGLGRSLVAEFVLSHMVPPVVGGHVPWGAEVEYAYRTGYESRAGCR